MDELFAAISGPFGDMDRSVIDYVSWFWLVTTRPYPGQLCRAGPPRTLTNNTH